MVYIAEQVLQYIDKAKLHTEFLLESNQISKAFIERLSLKYTYNFQTLENFRIVEYRGFVDAVTELTAIDLSETRGLESNQINNCLSLFKLIKNCLTLQNLDGLYLTIEQEEKSKSKKLNVFCVEPKIAFMSLMAQQPHSVILTSGTLKPLDTFAKEIGLNCAQ